jgi:ABC-2 type transport system permease protein
VTDAALYLLRCTAWNRGRRLLRQLRSPRYALAVLVGVAYLGLVLFGQRAGPGGGLATRAVAGGGTLFLLVLVAKWWLLGADRSALAFAPAEVQFLFPAPLSRAALLAYKLGRNQVLVLFNVLLWTMLFWRRADGAHPLLHMAGLWIFFTTLSLHRLGTALTRDSLLVHGRAGWRRAWPAVVVAGLLVGVGVVTARQLAPPNGNPLEWLLTLAGTAPLSWLVWPFRLPLGPLAAESGWAFARALPAGLLVVGLHVLWILRADRSFEEAAIEASARRAELLSRWRRQGTVAPLRPEAHRRRLPLGATGSPVLAIMWKNLTRLLRTTSPAFLLTLLLLLVGIVVVGGVVGEESGNMLGFVGVLALSWAGMLTLLGPQWVRVDLRGEVEHLDLIRSWPLPGRQIMTGMILSSATVLTALQLVLGGVGLGALLAQDRLPSPPRSWRCSRFRPSRCWPASTSCPSASRTGAPSCTRRGCAPRSAPVASSRWGSTCSPRGVSFLLLLLFLVGPAALGGGIGYLLHGRIGPWAALPAGAVAAAALLLEAFLLVDWLGDRLEAGARDADD